ncbi:ABC transporter permease [Candidatus Altiarchaeota archaeon]
MSQGRYIICGQTSRTEKVRYSLNILWALTVREFKGRYRRSLLGPLWAIIQPLFYMLLFVFMKSLFQISDEGVPYSLFTYSALVPFTFFSTAINRCGYGIYNNTQIIKKTPVPREVYLIAAILIALIEFFVSAIILFLMMLWFKIQLSWHILWVLPILFLTCIAALGFGMGLSAIGTFKQDVLFGIPFIMQFWMLATPVMYPYSQVPAKWGFLYSLNPMVGIIEGFRAIIIKGIAPDFTLLGISAVVSIVVLAVTWPFFRYLSQYFADVL